MSIIAAADSDTSYHHVLLQTCVVLTSSMVSITEQKYEIGHLKQLLDGNKIVYTEVDCSLEENRDTRNLYFEASGIRANYPQVFLQDPEGKKIQYIGSFKEIQVRDGLVFWFVAPSSRWTHTCFAASM